jgi:RND family efflux transporter MFP subunit
MTGIYCGWNRDRKRQSIVLGLIDQRWIVLLLFASCILAGCHRAAPEHEEAGHSVTPRPVLSMIAAPQSGPSDGYGGLIEPRYHTDLSFRVLGRIVAREVNVGDMVKAGQRLARLDPELLEVAVKSQEATLSNVKAQLFNSESNLKRQTILLAKNITPQAEFDLALQANETAAAAVTQAEANLAKAREQLGYANLIADMDGVVTSIDAESGQTVASGQNVISIASPDLREAVVDMGEEITSTLAPGSEFRIVLQVSPEYETIGRVREIAPQADASTRTRRVRITLDNPADAFPLGSTITAFPKQSVPTKIRLPNTAILHRDGQSFVWTVDIANKKVDRVAVNISRQDELGVEIADGIDAGARVVTAGVNSLVDGQSIRLNTGDTP